MAVDEGTLDEVRKALNAFSPVTKKAWEELSLRYRERLVRADELFIREGDAPSDIAFIVSGLFRVYYLADSLDERVMVFRAEGELLAAYSAFLENTPARYSAQALEDSRLLCISLKDFVELGARHPCLQAVEAKYVRMLYLEKEKREIELLSKDAANRYELFLERYPKISGRLRQYHIAAYLGITPVALSRIRNRRVH